MSKNKGKKDKGKTPKAGSRFNWVPDEGGTSERFRTFNSQGKEPVYLDGPGMRNTGLLDKDKDKHPYASDPDGRMYEYVARSTMPEKGKYEKDGVKYKVDWEYVGQRPEEKQYRGDDSWTVGGEDVWRRVLQPIEKKQKNQAVASSAAETPAATPAGDAAAPSAAIGMPGVASSQFVQQPADTSMRISTGQDFLQNYMRNDPFQIDLSSAYAPYQSGSLLNSDSISLSADDEEENLAWYDRPY